MNWKFDKYAFVFKIYMVFFVFGFWLNDIGFLLNYSSLRRETLLSKSSSVILFIASLLFIIVGKRIKLFSQSYTLIAYGIVSFAVGGLRNGLSLGTFSHIYSFIMPITMANVGYYFAQYYQKSKEFRGYTENSIKILIIIEFALTLLYMYLRNRGAFFANSFGAGGLILGSLFFLANGNYTLTTLSILGVLMSNKRSSLVIIGSGFLVYLRKSAKNRIPRRLVNFAIIASLITLLIAVFNRTDYLNRYATFLEMDFSNIQSIHVATSFRTLEMEYVIRFLLDSPLNFLFGAGFGGELYNGFFNVRYIHFSPLNYAFISGVPFSILMYFWFTLDTLKALKLYNEGIRWVVVTWVAYFILTFTAATVSTHSVTWFILGAVKYSNNLHRTIRKKDSSQIN